MRSIFAAYSCSVSRAVSSSFCFTAPFVFSIASINELIASISIWTFPLAFLMVAGRAAIPQATIRSPASPSSRMCWQKRRHKQKRNSRPPSNNARVWMWRRVRNTRWVSGWTSGTNTETTKALNARSHSAPFCSFEGMCV